MKKCKYCKSEIDDKAKVCPVCKKRQTSTIAKIILFIGIPFLLISSCSILTNKVKETNETRFSTTIEKSYKGPGNVGYYIEGIVTNNLDMNYSYVQISLACYDSNNNLLDTAIDNTNYLGAKGTWKYKATLFRTDASDVDHCELKEVTGW